MSSLAVFPHSSAARSLVRVVTYNIAGGVVPESEPIALAQQQQPDVLLVQEVLNRKHFARLGQHLHLPYGHFASYRRRSGGLAILSRWPLGTPQILPWPSSPQGKLALAAQVDSPAGSFWVCSVHLDNPLSARGRLRLWQKMAFLWQELVATTPRSQEAQDLQEWFMRLGGAHGIVGGDFNSLPFAGADRHMRQSFEDALSGSLVQYFTGTYWGPPRSPILPRIDFLYHASGWQVIEARVVQHKASDHFPVLAVLARKDQEHMGHTLQSHRDAVRMLAVPSLHASRHTEAR